MADKIQLFAKIFKAELEDLSDDLECSEKCNKDKLERDIIGSFVFQENEALIIKECSCISFILKRLEDFDLSKFTSLDALVDSIKLDVLDLTKEYEFPEFVPLLISKKLEKILTYVEG